MKWTTSSFVAAKEATEKLISVLALTNSRFDVEPVDAGWEVHLECETRHGWKELRLTVDAERLENALRDEAVRAALAAEWNERLADATRSRRTDFARPRER